MNSAAYQEVKGLTRVILDSLVEVTPQVLASGESWDEELFTQVRENVRRRLAPRGHDSAWFDLVFRRSFGEAKLIFQQLLSITPLDGSAGRPGRHHATA